MFEGGCVWYTAFSLSLNQSFAFSLSMWITATVLKVQFHSEWLAVMWPGQTWAERLSSRLRPNQKHRPCITQPVWRTAVWDKNQKCTNHNILISWFLYCKYTNVDSIISVVVWWKTQYFYAIFLLCPILSQSINENVINGHTGSMTARSWPLIYNSTGRFWETMSRAVTNNNKSNI